jgi:ATP-binding cassette subfamily B protein
MPGAVVPVLTGDAFNAMLQPQPDTSVLVPLALIIGVSQVIRGVLQLGRNFGAELLAQKLERDIRDELYLSLLGKSMTFHNLQPVGDTMARSTNDVREVNYMFSPGINLVIGSLVFIFMPIFVADVIILRSPSRLSFHHSIFVFLALSEKACPSRMKSMRPSGR